MSDAPETPFDRVPALAGYKSFAVCLIGTVVFGMLLLEGLWRSLGFSPSVSDDEILWSQARQQVEAAGPETLLILGRSRIHQGFVPEYFQAEAEDNTYIQLALGGVHPLATLRDVAERSDFSGTVLVSCSEASFMPELWEQQADYVDFYHREMGPWKGLIRGLRTALESRMTLLLPDVMLQRIGPELLRGSVPRQFLWMARDRTQIVDYHRVDLETFTANQLAVIRQNVEDYRALPGYETWVEHLPEMNRWVAQIQARGGQVVFLRMPTSGEYLATENEYFSREKFWDVLAENTPAATIHFEDVPVIRDMICAEGTHLHREDAIRFTEVLTQELIRRGLLRTGENLS